MVDRDHIHRHLRSLKLQPKLLLQCVKKIWRCRVRQLRHAQRIRILACELKLDVVDTREAGLVYNGPVHHNALQLPDEIADGCVHAMPVHSLSDSAREAHTQMDFYITV